MGPVQVAPVIENSGNGRSHLDASELEVARSIAIAHDALSTGTHLLGSLISTSYSFRARRWWRRSPFLPLPEFEYTRWRLNTAYGNERRLPSFGDIAAFSVWRQRIRRVVEMRST
ncbi:MAG: hypothetical protein ACREA0_19445 [bacterium]